jgi:hypothetical protein
VCEGECLLVSIGACKCGEAETGSVLWLRMQVPYLEDPNTGTAMFESTEIIKYLEDTYAA